MITLSTRGLTKVYDGSPVVNKLDLNIRSGRIIGLLGRNGAGKTTTFLMLSGIVKPDEGDVFLGDRKMNGIPSYERAKEGLVYLPQQNSVFLKTSVYTNLYQILELKTDPISADKRTIELLEDFGLMYVRDSFAFQLSGGEKRRLEIARAMIMNPKFLFLDEPFTGVDPLTILEIQKIILKLKKRGIGIIITDHNVMDTFNITDKVYIIHQGEILSFGTPSEVVKEEKTKKLFLGDDFKWNDVPKAPESKKKSKTIKE